MVQDWLALMPKEGGSGVLALACVGLVIGLVLWTAGARLNRMVVTLFAVTVGGILGMWVPRAMGWDVNTMATSLTIAMCLGALGFATPRLWVGAGLMTILSLWAAVGAWLLGHENAKLVIPRSSENLRDFFAALWLSFPAGVKSALPLAVAMASISGLALTILWKRLATTLFYSMTGVTLMLLGALCVARLKGINYPQFLPQRTDIQWLLLAGMVALGAMVQYFFLPMKKKVIVERQEPQRMRAAA